MMPCDHSSNIYQLLLKCSQTPPNPLLQTALVAGVARMSAAGVPHKNVFGEVFRSALPVTLPCDV